MRERERERESRSEQARMSQGENGNTTAPREIIQRERGAQGPTELRMNAILRIASSVRPSLQKPAPASAKLIWPTTSAT